MSLNQRISAAVCIISAVTVPALLCGCSPKGGETTPSPTPAAATTAASPATAGKSLDMGNPGGKYTPEQQKAREDMAIGNEKDK